MTKEKCYRYEEGERADECRCGGLREVIGCGWGLAFGLSFGATMMMGCDRLAAACLSTLNYAARMLRRRRVWSRFDLLLSFRFTFDFGKYLACSFLNVGLPDVYRSL